MPGVEICSRIRKTIEGEEPSLVFSCLQLDDQIDYDSMVEYFSILEDVTVACDVLHIDTQFNERWRSKLEIPMTHCQGNLSFATNNP